MKILFSILFVALVTVALIGNAQGQEDRKLQLNLLNYHSYTKGNYCYIFGIVANNDTIPIGFIKLTAELYDKNHQLIGTDFTYADAEILQPGETTTFKMIVSDSNVMTNVDDVDNYVISMNGRYHSDE